MSPWLIVTTGWPGVATDVARALARAGGDLPIVAMLVSAPVSIALGWVIVRRRRIRLSPERRSLS